MPTIKPETDVRTDDKPPGRRTFPKLLILCAGLATFLTLGWVFLHSFKQSAILESVETESLHTEELRNAIILNDALLTSSAQMATLTGDLNLEVRYLEHAKELDQAIKKARESAPEGVFALAINKIIVAHNELARMEGKAFDLVRAGQLERAKVILFGPDYKRQKTIYAAGIRMFSEELRAHTISKIDQEIQAAKMTAVVTGGMLVFLMLMWGFAYWNLNAWQAALTSARRKTEEASRAKDAFLANTSHEIRTPMNGIIGMTDILKSTGLSAEQMEYVDTISDSSNALLAIVNDILDLSKVEADQMTLHNAPFDLESAIDDVVALLSPKAREKGLDFIFYYDPSNPRFFIGDVGRLRQVVTNILGNAIKFTLEGRVSVEVFAVPEGERCKVSVKVSDTGIGIPLDKQAQVFDAFQQVDDKASREFEGTGLGLAISQRLAHLMGGEISVRSAQDRGTEFTASFLFEHAEDNSVPAEEQADGDLSGMHVLIVDDIELNRRILADKVQKWGAYATLADGSAQAFEVLTELVAKDQLPDIAIVDYQMPESSGLELIEKLQASEVFGSVAALLYSSVDTVDPVQARKIGARDVLLKPAREQTLKNAIAKCISPDKARQAIQAAFPEADLPELPDGLRILVAEDNKTNRLVVERYFSSQPIELQFATNGEEAVRKYRSFGPDIILMDWSMPVLNGLEATKKIRSLEAPSGTRRVTVIGLSANALDRQREQAMEAGMDDYLAKPVRKMDLMAKLNQHSGQAMPREF